MQFKDYSYVSFTCIKENINIIQEALYQIITKKGDKWLITNLDSLDISSVYFPKPQRKVSDKRKFILWESLHYPNTTIFMSNVSDGWDTLIHILNHQFKYELVKVHLSGNNYEFPNFSFHHRMANKQRLVMCIKENRWIFYEKGEIMFYEKKEYYLDKIIKKRLTFFIIQEYLVQLGWDITDDTFYSPIGSVRLFEEI